MAQEFIDFQRYRNQGNLFWNWGVLGDDTRGENNFTTMSDAVMAYFNSVGESVTMQIGEAFPEGYGPLVKMSDDLYRIAKGEDEEPEG